MLRVYKYILKLTFDSTISLFYQNKNCVHSSSSKWYEMMAFCWTEILRYINMFKLYLHFIYFYSDSFCQSSFQSMNTFIINKLTKSAIPSCVSKTYKHVSYNEKKILRQWGTTKRKLINFIHFIRILYNPYINKFTSTQVRV